MGKELCSVPLDVLHGRRKRESLEIPSEMLSNRSGYMGDSAPESR